MLEATLDKIRARGITSAREVLLPISFFVFVIIMWQYAVDQKYVPTVILPPPGDVVAVLQANRDFMAGHAMSTLYE